MSAHAMELMGVGLYTLSDAARIIRAKPSHVKRWVEGYSYPYNGDRRFSEPVLKPSLQPIDNMRVLTFLDLVELQFISLFRKEGVSMPVIRAASKAAARRFGTDHPFASSRFTTDGKAIFAVLQPENVDAHNGDMSTIVEELHKSQMVFAEVIEPFFRNIEWGAQEAMRLWPLGKDHRVVIDPKRQFGAPIDSETGIPTAVLYANAVEGGNAPELVAEWYEIPLDAVERAVEYETHLRTA